MDKHMKEVIDYNAMYEVVDSNFWKGEKDVIRLDTKWVLAIRDGALKARLVARDIARTKRLDLFAPGSNMLVSKFIDVVAVRENFGYVYH